MRRLFIAINLPTEIKEKIREKIDKLPKIPEARFLDEQNWHITLVFLGYQEEVAAANIVRAMSEAVKQAWVSLVEFSHLSYGPIGAAPRMVWLNGTKETDARLGIIKEILENKLVDNHVRFKRESRAFKTHITLARFHHISGQQYPPIDVKLAELKLSFVPIGLDLMESHLSRSGAQYEILQKIKFGG